MYSSKLLYNNHRRAIDSLFMYQTNEPALSWMIIQDVIMYDNKFMICFDSTPAQECNMFGGRVFTIVSASNYSLSLKPFLTHYLLFFKQSIFISSVFFPVILQIFHFSKLENPNLQSSKRHVPPMSWTTISSIVKITTNTHVHLH